MRSEIQRCRKPVVSIFVEVSVSASINLEGWISKIVHTHEKVAHIYLSTLRIGLAFRFGVRFNFDCTEPELRNRLCIKVNVISINAKKYNTHIILQRWIGDAQKIEHFMKPHASKIIDSKIKFWTDFPEEKTAVNLEFIAMWLLFFFFFCHIVWLRAE